MKPPPRSDLGKILHVGPPFPSKSGGRLHVLLQLDGEDVEKFLGQTQSLRL